MNWSKQFETDLESLYIGDLTFDQFVKQNKSSIQAIASYAIRYKTDWIMSDDDDMFQEACICINTLLWTYDESRDVSLTRYVVYNTGAMLRSVIRKEKAKKRHPNSKKQKTEDYLCEHNGSGTRGNLSVVPKPLISSYNTETYAAIKEVIEQAEVRLSESAKALVVAMINNSGIFAQAANDLLKDDELVKRCGIDDKSVIYTLKCKILPEVTSFFKDSGIMDS